MHFPIIIDPDYQNTYWCRQTLMGIFEETGKKKVACTIVDAANLQATRWDQLFTDERRLVVVIGTSVAWLPEVLAQLQSQDIHVVLVSLQPPFGFSGVSAILMDHVDTTHAVLQYLTGIDKARVALYGINPNSSADQLKVDCFRHFFPQLTDEDCEQFIFYNYASLDDCYKQYRSRQQSLTIPLQAVVCANDVVAISLIRHLERDGHHVPADLYLVSFGDTLMARLYSTPLTSVSLNHMELGRQAVAALSYLTKNPAVVSVSIKVECRIHIRESTGYRQAQNLPSGMGQWRSVPQIDFYDDDEVTEILAVEHFINRCDELDLKILDGLFCQLTYSDLAEQLYLAENALKYRIKRMISWLQLEDRNQLLSLLSSYLSRKSLLEAGLIKQETEHPLTF